MSFDRNDLDISVVAPAHNEAGNLRTLVEEIERAMHTLHVSYEIIIVDDGSTDDTPDLLDSLRRSTPSLRPIRMSDTPPGRGNGQSAAFHAGFRAARGRRIVTLDADLQNDPADIPLLVRTLNEQGVDVVQGDRSRVRADGLVRKVSSWVGRTTRRMLLGDSIRDTGCSLRIMRRDVALALPLQLRGAHRFIPVMARQLGFTVVEVPVNHRVRGTGETKYGIWNRALPGLIDCFGVRWMANRRRPVSYESLAPGAEAKESRKESA